MSLIAVAFTPGPDCQIPMLPPNAAVAGSQLSKPPRRHPAALWVLSAAEGGERFGFFLMLASFILFLNERMGFSEARAADIYGFYLTAVNAMPIVCGYVAGRCRSRRFWTMFGLVTLAAGYFLLAACELWSLYLALGVLVLGNGFFKPNISVLIGNLYSPADARRDEAFGIFYLAVNIGGMFGPLVGELLRIRYGWWAAFSVAGVALLASALTLHLGRRLQSSNQPPQATMSSQPAPLRRRMLALLMLSVLLIPFWMAYNQYGSSLAFWARDGVERVVHIAGSRYEIPPGWFASSGAAFVLLLTAPLALLARRLGLSSAGKVTCGVALGALSFAILCWAAAFAGSTLVSPLWLAAHYLLMTAGEVLLTPICLSLVSKLSPPRWAGVLFGAWYVSTAAGNWLAGSVVRLWLKWPHAHFFAFLSLLLLVVAGLLASQLGWLRRTLPQEQR